MELHSRLKAAAVGERRSMQAQALVLLEAGLGEGEPGGDGAGSGAAPSAAVQAATVGAADTASSPSPSSALTEREPVREAVARLETVDGSGESRTPSRSASADQHFKPDPKPGKK